MKLSENGIIIRIFAGFCGAVCVLVGALLVKETTISYTFRRPGSLGQDPIYLPNTAGALSSRAISTTLKPTLKSLTGMPTGTAPFRCLKKRGLR